MHREAYNYVTRFATKYGPFKSVLEVGSRYINGSVRILFTGLPYVGIDVIEGRDVDVVADGATYQPDPNNIVDCVVCCEVLEHTPEAHEVVLNMGRVVKNGGYVVITAAGEGREPHSGVDGGALRDQEYYKNITSDELQYWLQEADLSVLDLTIRDVDIYAIAMKTISTPVEVPTTTENQ